MEIPMKLNYINYMSFEIVETDTDLQIKNDIQRFVDDDYINILGKDQNDFALKLSLLFNHTIIEKNESTYDKLVFTYGVFIGQIVLKMNLNIC